MYQTFQSSSEFKINFIHGPSKDDNFQSSSEFKSKFQVSLSGNAWPFQSSSEFKQNFLSM